MTRLLVGLLVCIAMPSMACDQRCIPVLDIEQAFQDKMKEVNQKFPQKSAEVRMLEAGGIELNEWIRQSKTEGGNTTRMSQYLAARTAASQVWYDGLMSLWTGAKTKNIKIQIKILQGAVDRCKRACY